MSASTKNSGIVINALLLLAAFFLQYNGIFTVSLFGASPCFPLCIVICISIFVSETSAFFTGLLAGIVADAFASTFFGFNSIIFSVICLFTSLISHYLFNKNIYANAVLELLFTFIYYAVRFILFYGNLSAGEILRYLTVSAVPSAIFTAVISVLIYFAEKKIYKNAR